jgi:hypothetical protein
MEQVGDNIALFVSPVDEEVKRTIPYTTFGFLFFIFLQIDLMHICGRKVRGSEILAGLWPRPCLPNPCLCACAAAW